MFGVSSYPSGLTSATISFHVCCTSALPQAAIAAIRGGDDAPAYNASKAFVSNYMEGLRKKAKKAGKEIYITDIQPGFVDTAMAQGDNLFWVASPEEAAQQIYNAIEKKKRRVYITRRWGIFAILLKVLPGFVYDRL